MPAEKAVGGRGDTMVNLVIILECFGILLTMAALLLLLNGDGAKEQKLLIIILCGSLVQNVGYLLELTASTVEAAMTAVTVENVGSAFVPLCYCWFLYVYCYIAPPKILLRILGTVSFFALPSVFLTGMDFFTGISNGFRMHPDFIMSVLATALCMCFFCSAVSLFPIPYAFIL